MKPSTLFAATFGCALALGAHTGAFAMQAISEDAIQSQSNTRHLSAELISQTSREIVTTAGRFALGPGVTIDDRRGYQERFQSKDSATPKVDLMFDGERLRRVTIY